MFFKIPAGQTDKLRIMYQHEELQGSKPERYAQLLEMSRALIHGESDRYANAANLSALLYMHMADVNWLGFYFYDGNELVVGPFQGKPACIRIAVGRGVCGTAAQTGKTQRVHDVEEFPGHIACDAASRSELVIPLMRGNALVGVLDIDSPVVGRFDEEDQAGLEAIAALFVHSIR